MTLDFITDALAAAPARMENAIENGTDKLDTSVTNAWQKRRVRIATRIVAALLAVILLVCTTRFAAQGYDIRSTMAAIGGGILLAFVALSLLLNEAEEL